MSLLATPRLRYEIHGQSVEIALGVGALDVALAEWTEGFAVQRFAATRTPIRGTIEPYMRETVLRHLSPTATRIASPNDLLEIYQEDERFWLVDDHWGLCELNLLKSTWRSWILPTAAADPAGIIEHAVIWPLSQLLRRRGLTLLPALSVARDGFGVLLLSNFSIEPELTALVNAGYRVVGQSWTALRDRDGRIEMLHVPGRVERLGKTVMRVDLTRDFPGSHCDQADCSAVITLMPGRRPLPHLKPITPTNAAGVLRRRWPLEELHPQHRGSGMSLRLAQRCTVFEAQLSRTPSDVIGLLATTRQPKQPQRAVEPRRAVA